MLWNILILIGTGTPPSSGNSSVLVFRGYLGSSVDFLGVINESYFSPCNAFSKVFFLSCRKSFWSSFSSGILSLSITSPFISIIQPSSASQWKIYESVTGGLINPEHSIEKLLGLIPSAGASLDQKNLICFCSSSIGAPWNS